MSEKYIYKKRFYDLEKEENWLTEMSEKGLALKDVSISFLRYKYSFEPCEKRYVYRVDYNNEPPVLEEMTSPYVMFVTGTYEAEYVLCRQGKVYFRKAADKGDFPPIYTNPESRLAVEKKKLLEYTALALLFVADILLSCTPLGTVFNLSLFYLPSVWLKLAVLLISIICLLYCARGAYIHCKKIKEIKNKT